MPSQSSTFWPLNSRLGWQTDHSQGIAVGTAGIRLASDPNGPLSLTWIDDSLGGVILPRGMAVDANDTLYLLSKRDPIIKRFDPQTRAFEIMAGIGGDGHDARQFHYASSIAVTGDNLYVVDRGNRRVQVFALYPRWPLRYVWGPWDANQRHVAFNAATAWDPVDVASHADHAYVLDRKYARVYRHRVGTDALELIIDEPASRRRWTRIAVDQAGQVYLLDRRKRCVDIFDAQGRRLGEADDAGDFRDRFAPPLARLRYRSPDDDRTTGRFRYCDLVFDREGRPAQIEPDEPLGPRSYLTHGTWFSSALDSHIYRCLWHRIELELGDLPAGAHLIVSTHTAEAASQPPDETSPLWTVNYTIAGQMQPPPNTTVSAQPTEFLVQSRAGQYLWLKIEVRDDGYATPLIQSLRVHYPRESYLSYLPAVYAADDDSRWFLERFLSIFQTEWDGVDQQIETMAQYFDPAAVPPGPFLEYLASWLALPLEGTWTEEQKRNLLMAAPGYYPQRGTLAGLRRFLQVYLQNMTGLTPSEQNGYPQIIEGFRERQRLMLTTPDRDALNLQTLLWGPAQVGRLQLDVFAREGEVRLVSTGDPERDLFHEYAHRFRVFVPSAWIKTADDEQMLRRALNAEKPAQTSYDLCLVEPRIRVGLQSTVGIDMILGDYPVAWLACLQQDATTPASRAPRGLLGYDTILGSAAQPGAPAQVGIDTVLM